VLVAPLHSSLAQDHTEAGVLTCEQVGARVNPIIHSTADIACEFTDTKGSVECYQGEAQVGSVSNFNEKKRRTWPLPC